LKREVIFPKIVSNQIHQCIQFDKYWNCYGRDFKTAVGNLRSLRLLREPQRSGRTDPHPTSDGRSATVRAELFRAESSGVESSHRATHSNLTGPSHHASTSPTPPCKGGELLNWRKPSCSYSNLGSAIYCSAYNELLRWISTSSCCFWVEGLGVDAEEEEEDIDSKIYSGFIVKGSQRNNGISKIPLAPFYKGGIPPLPWGKIFCRAILRPGKARQEQQRSVQQCLRTSMLLRRPSL